MMFVEACATEYGYGAFAHGVDLRLAENYLPGGVCLLKGFALSCLLYCVELQDAPIWFAVLALGLAFDRVYENSRILDCNALLWGVYTSRVVLYCAAIDRENGMTVPSLCLRGVYLLWFAVACAVANPGAAYWHRGVEGMCTPLRSWLAGGQEGARGLRLYMLFTGGCLCAVLFGHGHRGTSLHLAYARVFLYLTLSVIWVYTVGLHGSRWGAGGVDNSVHLVCIFAGVLYLPTPLAAIFTAWAVLCILRGGVQWGETQSDQTHKKSDTPPMPLDVECGGYSTQSQSYRLTDFGLDLRKGGGLGPNSDAYRSSYAPDPEVFPSCDLNHRGGKNTPPGSDQVVTTESEDSTDLSELFRQAKANALNSKRA